jgi:hypothetical protein
MDVLPSLLPDPESKSIAVATKPSIAGMYNVYPNGTSNSAADREAAIEVQKAMPDVFNIAKENRSFLHHYVRYMLGRGIKQFIDIALASSPATTFTNSPTRSIQSRRLYTWTETQQWLSKGTSFLQQTGQLPSSALIFANPKTSLRIPISLASLTFHSLSVS